MGKVFLMGSETVGRGDENLGYEITMAMLKALVRHENRPLAVVFWNTAVKLLEEGSPALPYLKALEEKGVHLLAGQLCVSELELTGKIAAGRPATMDEILDLLLHNEVVNL